MAEDVINSMVNMKLTSEEEEDIQISDEGRTEEIDSCALSLIGKFLTCKPYNRKVAKNTLRKAWGLDKELQISEVGSNLFQFKFQSDYELERILRGGPWTFDNQLLMLTRWRTGMSANNVILEHTLLWMQIWGVPFDMMSPTVVMEIGKKMGMVEDVERRRHIDDQSLFLRVRVALPIGPSEELSTTTKVKLGKRQLGDNLEENGEKETTKVKQKRAKAKCGNGLSDYTSAGVEDHPCRKP